MIRPSPLEDKHPIQAKEVMGILQEEELEATIWSMSYTYDGLQVSDICTLGRHILHAVGISSSVSF